MAISWVREGPLPRVVALPQAAAGMLGQEPGPQVALTALSQQVSLWSGK